MSGLPLGAPLLELLLGGVVQGPDWHPVPQYASLVPQYPYCEQHRPLAQLHELGELLELVGLVVGLAVGLGVGEVGVVVGVVVGLGVGLEVGLEVGLGVGEVGVVVGSIVGVVGVVVGLEVGMGVVLLSVHGPDWQPSPQYAEVVPQYPHFEQQ